MVVMFEDQERRLQARGGKVGGIVRFPERMRRKVEVGLR
jgi:hypothetical protein